MIRDRGNARLGVGRREVLAMMLGVALYAVLSLITNFAQLNGSTLTDVRPAVAVPVVMGFIFGPITGFVVGFAGNLAFDLLVGHVPVAVAASGNILIDAGAIYYLNWQIANGLTGLIPGLLALRRRRYRTFVDFGFVLLFIVLAQAIGAGFGAVTDTGIYPGYELQQSLNDQFKPIFIHNVVVSVLLVPFVLINWEYLDLKTLNLRSQLLRRLALFTFIAAIVPTLLLMYLLAQSTRVDPVTGEAVAGGLEVGQLIMTLMITFVFTVVNAVLASQSITVPLLHLSEAAKDMEGGDLTRERAAALKATVGDDEISQLSRVFGNMAEQVLEREAALRRQVESLRIEVDFAKQSKQVSEITDTDFFRDLQAKARSMRGRTDEDASLPSEDASGGGEPAPSSIEA